MLGASLESWVCVCPCLEVTLRVGEPQEPELSQEPPHLPHLPELIYRSAKSLQLQSLASGAGVWFNKVLCRAKTPRKLTPSWFKLCVQNG